MTVEERTTGERHGDDAGDLAGWGRGLRQLRRLRDLLTGPWRRGRSAIEMRRAIVDRAAARATYVGSGKRVFPYNHLEVSLYPRDEREAAEMAAAIDAGWPEQVRSAVQERLSELGCAPPDLTVGASVRPRDGGDDAPSAEDEAAAGEPFEIAFENVERAPLAERARPRLELQVVRGRAEQELYAFEQERIYVGRLPEVLDEHGRIRRRNHVAFLDDGEDNHTVSREQARIVYREDPPGFWLIDERSAHGTRIFRGGRPIDVSSRDRRGIRLRDGDEIYFGQAAVVCRIPSAKDG